MTTEKIWNKIDRFLDKEKTLKLIIAGAHLKSFQADDDIYF
jgi:hypothetical protein